MNKINMSTWIPHYVHQHRWASVFLFSMLFYILGVDHAFAYCTSQFAASALSATNSGLITAIMSSIVGLLQTTSEALYTGIIKNSNYQSILSASIILVVVMYGVMIVFDLENLRPGTVMMRIVKIGIVVWIASPTGGWTFFSETFAKFFFNTMLELVGVFLGGAAGAVQQTTPATQTAATQLQQLTEPLGILGMPMSLIFSAKFAVTILGVMGSGIYGVVMGLLLIWAGFSLMMAICQAMFVYVKCIVGLWFLFALAPLFFIFLLFQRTAKLFEGWLNMIINFMLQPVLLFSFLAFFIVMITSSLSNLFRVDWCWGYRGTLFSATPIPVYWFYADKVNGVEIQPRTVDWGLYGNIVNANIQFPIEMIDLLFFLMSSYLMVQYGKFVPQLASQLSQGGLNISGSSDDFRNFFNSRGWTPEQIGGKAVGGLTKLFR